MDILITVAEIGFLIVVFLILNWLVGICFKMASVTWFKERAERLTTQRRNAGLLLLLLCVGLCFLLAIGNGILIYQGKSVQEFQINLVQQIPAQFWSGLAVAIAKSVTLLFLVKLSLPLLRRLLDRACTFAKNYDRITANNDSIEAFFADLKKTVTTAVWGLAVILCTQFLYLPALVSRYLYIAFKAYVAIAVAQLLVKAVSTLIDTLDALSIRYSSPDNLLRYYERFRYLVPALKKCIEYILYVGIATLIIQEIDFIAWIARYSDEIIAVIAIYFLCGVANEFCKIILEDLVLRTESLTDLQRQRRLTIIPLFKSCLKYAIYFTAGLAILKLINLDPTPLLAGAGLLGIIIGFGAQNLINDIVCGFFVLFENYYLVGDYIQVGKENLVEGVVEAIELRTTHIRHPDGQLQIIHNGELGSVVNYSKQYIYAKVEVPVPHASDLDRLYRVIEEVGQQLKRECSDVLEATQIDGLENFGEDSLLLRTLTKVKPGKHLHVQRLLRRMLKSVFDSEQVTSGHSR